MGHPRSPRTASRRSPAGSFHCTSSGVMRTNPSSRSLWAPGASAQSHGRGRCEHPRPAEYLHVLFLTSEPPSRSEPGFPAVSMTYCSVMYPLAIWSSKGVPDGAMMALQLLRMVGMCSCDLSRCQRGVPSAREESRRSRPQVLGAGFSVEAQLLDLENRCRSAPPVGLDLGLQLHLPPALAVQKLRLATHDRLAGRDRGVCRLPELVAAQDLAAGGCGDIDFRPPLPTAMGCGGGGMSASNRTWNSCSRAARSCRFRSMPS